MGLRSSVGRAAIARSSPDLSGMRAVARTFSFG